jgi:hypothetical protein
MSSTDDKVEEMRCNVNEITDYADVIEKLVTAERDAKRGMNMMIKENYRGEAIITRLMGERDSALEMLQTARESQPTEVWLLEKISCKLHDLETGVLSDMSRKLDELWEESKKRRT